MRVSLDNGKTWVETDQVLLHKSLPNNEVLAIDIDQHGMRTSLYESDGVTDLPFTSDDITWQDIEDNCRNYPSDHLIP